MANLDSNSDISINTEIRKLRPAERYTLGQILSVSDCWKKLMAIIKEEGTNNILKFNNEHISIIEKAAYQQRQNAAEIFLDEWSTMGKKRPTLDNLLNYLVEAELFRAADYITVDILKGEALKRPEQGPAAVVHISEEIIYNNEWKSADLPACLNNVT